MLKEIDHIGVAVKSIAKVKEMYQDVFDLQPIFEETVEDQKVNVAGFRLGHSKIEFLEPLSAESPIAKYLSKRGEGLHHIAISVDNIAETLKKMKEKGLTLIDQEPRTGAEGKQIAFVHPSSFNGILVELTQKTGVTD